MPYEDEDDDIPLPRVRRSIPNSGEIPYPPVPAFPAHEAMQYFGKAEENPFIPHAILVERARLNPPSKISPTVTSFTDWIYDLYVTKKSKDSIKLSKSFLDRHKKAREDPAFPRRVARRDGYRIEGALLNNWEIKYEDPLDRPDERFSINALQVRRTSLVGRPDMVYRERGTGNILIVEHKCFWKLGQIPLFGWPNIKTQLWCYGMIDRWKNAPNIFVMGRVFDMRRWDYDATGYIAYNRRGLKEFLRGTNYMFNTKILNAKDPRVHRECKELFSLFGGSCKV